MRPPLFPILRHCLALVLGLAAVLSARGADLSPPETQALMKTLQEHRQKFPSLTADFVEEKNTHLLTKPLVSEGTISFLAPNKFRREVKGTSPSLTVSNGQKLWIYYPSFKEAELYVLGQRAFFDDSIAALTAGLNFQHVDQFYNYKASREPEGYRLYLTPRGGGLKRMLKELTVSLDNDFHIERTETVLPKGDHVITLFKNHRLTPIPPSLFDFTPPADAHISQPLGK